MPNTYHVWKSGNTLVAHIDHVNGRKIKFTSTDIAGEMQGVHQVHKGAESLVAVLLKDNEGKYIEITYIDEKSDMEICRYRSGSEIGRARDEVIFRKGQYCCEGDKGELPYIDAYRRLGPELRAKIPQDWHDVLGRWLKNDS